MLGYNLTQVTEILTVHLAPIAMTGVSVQVKEAELTPLLSPAGFVWELTIPQKDDGE